MNVEQQRNYRDGHVQPPSLYAVLMSRLSQRRFSLTFRWLLSTRLLLSFLIVLWGAVTVAGPIADSAIVDGSAADAASSSAPKRATADRVVVVDMESRTLNKQRVREIDPAAAVIDLTRETWRQGQLHTLDGNWDMFWNTLAVPDALVTLNAASERFTVPGLWNAPKGDAPARDRFGFATFRVNVRVPASIDPLFLKLPDIPSAYSLWINGEPALFNGQVGFGQSSEIPAFLPKVTRISNHGGLLEVVLQVSNFHYKEGGIWHSLKLTDASGEANLRLWPLIWDSFIIALLFAIGLYHVSIFAMRRQEKAALFFGLFCLGVSLRGLLVGQRIFYLSDWFEWDTLQAAEHILFYVCLPLFASFYRALFPAEVHKQVVFGASFAFIVFSLVTLLTPVYFFTLLAFPFQIIVLLFLFYVCFTWVKVYKQKRAGARLFGSSLLIFFLAVINDMLNANFVIQTVGMIEMGVIAFVISQVILLNRRYVKSLSLTENFSASLQEHNRQLIKLDEFKDEFLATTSHELKMPLHSIYGLSQVLINDPSIQAGQVQRHNLELISATAQRLSTLVNDILDFSSIKHSRLELQIEAVNLRMLLSMLLDTISPLIGSKDVALSADIDADVPLIQADANRLQQILFNLVGNAIKFTDEGFILIKARTLGKMIEIEVVDTGIGIPKDKQGLVLNPFEKLEQREKHQYTGTGLGLSISKQLVELQGGQLSLESKINLGTTVRFTLPRAEATGDGVVVSEHYFQSVSLGTMTQPESSAEPASVVTAGTAPDSTDTSPTGAESDEYALLYVVDDEEVNRQLLSRQLQSVGFVVETFAGGGAMLQRLDSIVPDLVILDLMMPNMNGFQVLSMIRERFNSYQLPVVMLTARHQSADIVRALSLGANDYLCKPYHDKELIARASSLLSVRRFWRVREENEKLQEEISRRKKAEDNLLVANQRLLTILNYTEEAVGLLDPTLTLLYANPGLVALLAGEHVSDLAEIEDYLPQDICDRLRSFAQQTESTVLQLSVALTVKGKSKPVTVTACCFDDAENRYLALAFIPQSHSSDKALSIISDISVELSASRNRIDALEFALQSVSQLLSQAESEPEKAIPDDYDSAISSPEKTEATSVLVTIQSDDSNPGKATSNQGAVNEPLEESFGAAVDTRGIKGSDAAGRQLLVQLLRLSLNLWERYTGKGKTELAEESKCWRVYLDGGTVKTRTLDKYLSPKSLPENPRWRSVIRTANFVMAKCTMESADQKQLSAIIKDIEDRFS